MPDQIEKVIIAIVAATALILFFGVIIIAYAFAYQKRKNKHSKEKQDMANQFQSTLLQTQIEIQEQTLKNIAQEIHDNIGQVLILAKLNLNTFPSFNDEETDIKVNDTRQLVGKAINDLRDLSRSLHGEKISELGLQESVSGELRILQNSGMYETALHTSGTKYRLDPQKEMILFRIVQESINNTVKHAKAKKIDVTIDYHPTVFKLCIADNGSGFDPDLLEAGKTGIGLKNMRDRAALINASFAIHSLPGNGTTVIIEIKNPEL